MIALLFVLQPVLPIPGDELHVVAVYESKVRKGGQDIPVKVQVVVNRPGKDITLFLSAALLFIVELMRQGTPDVPEPSAWLLLAGGIASVGVAVLWRRWETKGACFSSDRTI